MSRAHKLLGFTLVLVGVAIPLSAVSLAFACGRLTTLSVSPGTVARGAQLSGYGRNYNTVPTSSEVTIRLDNRSGTVLWSGRPAPNGDISPSFAAPAVSNGYHIVLAQQTLANGNPAPGTPGRATVYVGKRRANTHRRASSDAWPIASPGAGSGSGSGTAGIADSGVLLFSGLLSAALLAGGGVMLLRGRAPRHASITTL